MDRRQFIKTSGYAAVAGGSGSASSTAKRACTAASFCAHSGVMRAASAVVTHGGHGTVMRALAHGLPLLCLPMGRDQDDVAARVVARGAGLRLSAGASAAEIRVALGRLLVEPSYQAAARALGRAISAEVACSCLVDELERLATPAHRRAPPAAAMA